MGFAFLASIKFSAHTDTHILLGALRIEAKFENCVQFRHVDLRMSSLNYEMCKGEDG